MQRTITDFGADVSFAQVREKIREHYGIYIANGAAAAITEGHANRMIDTDMTPDVRPTKEALTRITQIDDSMILRVQTGKSDDSAQQFDAKRATFSGKKGNCR